MIDVVEIIYMELSSKNRGENLFEDEPQVDKAYKDYCDTYIEPKHKINWDKANIQYEAFNNAILSCRERAFEVGFKTAINLILSCKEL